MPVPEPDTLMEETEKDTEPEAVQPKNKIIKITTVRGGLVVSLGTLMFKHKSVLLRSPGLNPA